MKTFEELKKDYPDYLIIIRNKKFGEIFGEDIIIAKEVLNIGVYENKIFRFSWESLDNVLVQFIKVGIKVAVVN